MTRLDCFTSSRVLLDLARSDQVLSGALLLSNDWRFEFDVQQVPGRKSLFRLMAVQGSSSS